MRKSEKDWQSLGIESSTPARGLWSHVDIGQETLTLMRHVTELLYKHKLNREREMMRVDHSC